MSASNLGFIVIDDSKLDCVIAQKIISNATGTDRVQSFMFAREALNHIASAGSDIGADKTVLFVDIQMPVMNGFEFIEAFEQLPQEWRDKYLVYVISSSINESDIARATQYASVIRFISKPLTLQLMNELLSEIRQKV